MTQATQPRSTTISSIPPARRESLERLFARMEQVAALPGIAQRVLQLTDSEHVRADELREAIQNDPILVARILRRLNSSYYALSTKVTDLRTAISLLGFREIRNLAMTVCVSRMFETPGHHGTYRREALWEHSVAVGAAARLVARVCGRGVPEEAYIAGLLHDLGIILIDQSLRRHFCQVVSSVSPTVTTCEAENRILSFDHALLGGFVASKWNLAEPVIDAIAFHHTSGEYTGPHHDLVYVVAVANYLCSRAGWTSLGVHNVQSPPDSVYAGLGLDQISLAIIWDELEPTLERAESLATG
ncbi:phosphodiesterase [Anatilimnocola aggregata]|uniref:Phosphodiesterase n=1 Tax=Anatilimnocola aggregata TaxID=2528021 RepID=A0A517YJ45_9BACT|nr:HDOD domain-containing protein [Anatilimnocola aggregata]QDU30234.1 phosphodiesterase [Anatilimnocola aggregata]